MLLLIQVDQASAEDVFIILHGPLDIQTGLLIVLGFLNVLFQFIELLVCRNNHDFCDYGFFFFFGGGLPSFILSLFIFYF